MRADHPSPARAAAWAVALLASLALAGCLGGGAPDEEADEAGDEPSLEAAATGDVADGAAPPTGAVPVAPWNVTTSSCVLLVINVPIPVEQARQRLPPGFEPVAWNQLPTGTVPNTATAVAFVSRCASAVTPEGEVADHGEAMAYLYVQPPEAYRADGVDAYRALLWHGSSDDAVAAGYEAAGLSVDRAAIAAAADALGGGAESLEARVTAPGHAFSFRAPAAYPFPSSATTFRLFAVRDATVVGALDMRMAATLSNAGPSALLVEAGQGPFGVSSSAGAAVHYVPQDEYAYRVEPVPLATLPLAA